MLNTCKRNLSDVLIDDAITMLLKVKTETYLNQSLFRWSFNHTWNKGNTDIRTFCS